jgi:hypothetical protein
MLAKHTSETIGYDRLVLRLRVFPKKKKYCQQKLRNLKASGRIRGKLQKLAAVSHAQSTGYVIKPHVVPTDCAKPVGVGNINYKQKKRFARHSGLNRDDYVLDYRHKEEKE